MHTNNETTKQPNKQTLPKSAMRVRAARLRRRALIVRLQTEPPRGSASIVRPRVNMHGRPFGRRVPNGDAPVPSLVAAACRVGTDNLLTTDTRRHRCEFVLRFGKHWQRSVLDNNASAKAAKHESGN